MNDIFNDIKAKPSDITKFILAQQTWKRLEAVYAQKIPFISDDYSSLVNTLERYYKGYLEWKIATDPNCPIRQPWIDNYMGHNLLKGFNVINDSYISLYPEKTIDSIKIVHNFLKKMSHEYTACRYDKVADFSDFQRAFSFVEHQRNLLVNDMEQNKERYAYNERTNKDDYDDLDLE